jgi:hypothetical protein
MVKVKIAVPTAKAIEPETAACISYLMAYSVLQGITINLDIRKNSILPDTRNKFVQDAISDKNDYLLFIDDDMVFPQDLLVNLLAEKKQVIGCNCVTKNETHSKFTALDLNYKILPTLPQNKGAQQVSALGTGIMLMDLSIFDKLEMPYFSLIYDKENKRMVGEDYYFCSKLLDANISMYINHDLSRQTFHLGTKSYSIDHAINCFINNGLLSPDSIKSDNS